MKFLSLAVAGSISTFIIGGTALPVPANDAPGLPGLGDCTTLECLNTAKRATTDDCTTLECFEAEKRSSTLEPITPETEVVSI